MSVLTVGSGQQYHTIAAAVAAAHDGDTVNVMAGTYTNDFVEVNKNLTLNAVGGQVIMNATVSPPDGKAILTEGAPGLTVNITGFTFEGAAVPDGNGAGIRYEGGTLNLENDGFFNNQDGILGAADPNGVITIDHSEFGDNGVGGSGQTHNIYIGAINTFTLTNSFSHDANVGHEVKSRAANNVIENNVIADNGSNSSYEIDLPNGGNATISGNVIEQGSNSQNPNIIAIGEEGVTNPTNTISVTGNTIINDQGDGPALWNNTGTTANFSNNSVYGFGGNALVNGSANQSGTTELAARPTITEAIPGGAELQPGAASLGEAPLASAPVPSASGLVIDVSGDAYQGNAQFTVLVDGQQVGSVHTATASHAAGATQEVDLGPLSAGPHIVGVYFTNDAYGGTPDTDRNLYVDQAYYDGQPVAGAAATLLSSGDAEFQVNVGQLGNASPVSTSPTQVVDPTPPASTSTPSSTASNVSTTSSATSGLVIDVSEDAYQGDAQFTVTVDGKQVGGVQTATALHEQGQTQAVDIGSLVIGQHTIGVTFLNDKYDGTAQTDRNLYVDQVYYNGQSVGGPETLLSAGTVNFSAVGDQSVGTTTGTSTTSTSSASTTTTTTTTTTAGTPAAGDLVVKVSEDAYQGDAQFTVKVDGQQVGGIMAATALHGQGQTQAIDLGNLLSPGQHQIGVSFLNDAYAGTPSTDRNLYVDGITVGGQAQPNAQATMDSAGTDNFAVTASSDAAPITSSMVLNMSEDAYQGDAQFTVSVDGKQYGGVYTATASHAAGQGQAVTISGIPELFQPHDIAVTFLNDKYDGTAQTDRNLYVNSAQIDGQPVPGGSLTLLSAGTQHITAMAPSNWTG